ncbi:MAG: Leucine-rich repeat (LRR) protein [Colwellia sp.]|jgi:Leucine-rich repeat (LRR) protein
MKARYLYASLLILLSGPAMSFPYTKISEITKFISDVNLKRCIEELGPDTDFRTVKKLNCSNQEIEDIEILQLFSSLTHLNISHNNIRSIGHLSEYKSLAFFYLDHNKLTELDVSELPSLRWLLANNNQLETIKLNNRNLKSLDLSSNKLTEIDLSSLEQLGTLNVDSNKLSSIAFRADNDLQSLNLNENQLTEIDTSQLTGLRYFDIERNQLSSLALKNSPGITTVNASNNRLNKFSLINCNELTDISVQNNESLNRINGLETCPKIEKVEFEGNPTDCKMALFFIEQAEKKHQVEFKTKHQC